jgi:enoyl-CoA hydratase/carnithine racemase/uncharacterized OB-fold protein
MGEGKPMSDYKKPIPVIQPWTREFWNATKQHRLLIQECNDCKIKIFYPRKYCPECWSSNLGWSEASGKAKVYTFSIMIDMVEPKFMPDLPYVLAMVDLEEGIRMTTRIVDCDPDAVHIGMDVAVVFEDITEECALPMFRPITAEKVKKGEATPEQEQAKPATAQAMGPDNYQTILYEIGGPNNSVCRITLNRPQKMNAINRQMAKELIDAFRRVRDVSSVGVVVFSGAGEEAFCTGGDLEVFPSLAEHQNCLNWMAHEGFDAQKAITECEKVVICKIDGHCLAGGLELALSCDLLYAKESARIGTTEINMGILPGWGGTARLPRSMPIFRAREIIYSGRKDYTAKELYEMGFLTRVFKDDEFEEKFEEVVANIAAKKPIALRMGKEIMARSAEGGSIDTALAVERNGITWLTYSPDIQAVMDMYRQEPDQLVKDQKKSNVESEVKGE